MELSFTSIWSMTCKGRKASSTVQEKLPTSKMRAIVPVRVLGENTVVGSRKRKATHSTTKGSARTRTIATVPIGTDVKPGRDQVKRPTQRCISFSVSRDPRRDKSHSNEDRVYSSSSSSGEDSDSSYGGHLNFKKEEMSDDEYEDEADWSGSVDVKDVKPGRSRKPTSTHLRTSQFRAPLLQCVVCKNRIVSRSNNRTSRCMHLLTHAKMHHNQKQFRCSVCSYMSNNHMQRHIAGVHKGKAKVQDLMTDALRASFRDMAIQCFPSMSVALNNWYNGSKNGALMKGGRPAKNTVRVFKDEIA